MKNEKTDEKIKRSEFNSEDVDTVVKIFRQHTRDRYFKIYDYDVDDESKKFICSFLRKDNAEKKIGTLSRAKGSMYKYLQNELKKNFLFLSFAQMYLMDKRGYSPFTEDSTKRTQMRMLYKVGIYEDTPKKLWESYEDLNIKMDLFFAKFTISEIVFFLSNYQIHLSDSYSFSLESDKRFNELLGALHEGNSIEVRIRKKYFNYMESLFVNKIYTYMLGEMDHSNDSFRVIDEIICSPDLSSSLVSPGTYSADYSSETLIRSHSNDIVMWSKFGDRDSIFLGGSIFIDAVRENIKPDFHNQNDEHKKLRNIYHRGIYFYNQSATNIGDRLRRMENVLSSFKVDSPYNDIVTALLSLGELESHLDDVLLENNADEQKKFLDVMVNAFLSDNDFFSAFNLELQYVITTISTIAVVALSKFTDNRVGIANKIKDIKENCKVLSNLLRRQYSDKLKSTLESFSKGVYYYDGYPVNLEIYYQLQYVNQEDNPVSLFNSSKKFDFLNDMLHNLRMNSQDEYKQICKNMRRDIFQVCQKIASKFSLPNDKFNINTAMDIMDYKSYLCSQFHGNQRTFASKYAKMNPQAKLGNAGKRGGKQSFSKKNKRKNMLPNFLLPDPAEIFDYDPTATTHNEYDDIPF